MGNEIHQNSTQVLSYNPQLDGLRFFAVLFVVTYHWLPSITHLEVSYFLGGLINFFFVLSSYLITKILYSAREKSINAGIPKYKMVVVFLLRRTIRIFPAYYFFLFVVMLLPIIGNEVRDHAGMYFSYLVNYQIFHDQTWPLVTPHIWTLAVEEQFYVFWPIIILFIRHRYLAKTFLLIILIGVVLRMIYYQPVDSLQQSLLTQSILTQYCIDAFALGGLLAYKSTLPDSQKKIFDKILNVLFCIAIPLAILIIITKSHYFSFVINGLLLSIISMKLIEGAVLGYKGIVGKFLQHRIVVFIGRISYGIYLYHLLVPVVFWKLFDMSYDLLHSSFPYFFERNERGVVIFFNIIRSELFCFIVYSILTIAVALLSWNLIEKPFARLKVFLNFGQKKSSIAKAGVTKELIG